MGRPIGLWNSPVVYNVGESQRERIALKRELPALNLPFGELGFAVFLHARRELKA
jgi:hypothetical protein